MPKPTSAAKLLKIVDQFDWQSWSSTLADGLEQDVSDIVNAVGAEAAAEAGGSWVRNNPFMKKFVTQYVGERITQLEDTTKAEVSDLIRTTLDTSEGLTMPELATKVSDLVTEKFENYEGYRALRIARTEVGIATNNASVMGYSAAGVEEVDVSDGTEDEECADANGERWDVEDALSDPLAHPNCERSFSPVPVDNNARGAAIERMALKDWALIGTRVALATRRLWSKPDPHNRPFDPEPESEAA